MNTESMPQTVSVNQVTTKTKKSVTNVQENVSLVMFMNVNLVKILNTEFSQIVDVLMDGSIPDLITVNHVLSNV
jgi:hypothetical protein